MTSNVNLGSPVFFNNNVEVAAGDLKDTIRSFWDEMATILKDYADLSLNPDADRTLQIGLAQVPGDQVNNSAVTLLLEDRLSKIELAQNSLLDIWNKMIKLEDRLNASA